MHKKRGKSLALMFGMVLMLTSASVLMPGCSSSKVAKSEANRVLTHEEMLDHLKVSKEERPLVEKVMNSRTYIVYKDVHAEYQKLLKTMSREEADKTSTGKTHSEMFKALTSSMTTLDLSPKVIAAVLASVGCKESNESKNENKN